MYLAFNFTENSKVAYRDYLSEVGRFLDAVADRNAANEDKSTASAYPADKETETVQQIENPVDNTDNSNKELSIYQDSAASPKM